MKNVLIPTDLTDNTVNAIKYAITLRMIGNAKLFFYHVSSDQKSDDVYLKSYIKSIFLELKLDFEKSETEFIFEKGSFSDEQIKNIIKSHKIDFLIIAASHEGFEKTFFNSYVSDLINEIRCPVLTFPHGYNNFKMEKIGFASELFDLSVRLHSIIPFAKRFNAHIEIFHVYPVFPQEADINEYNSEEFLDRIKQLNAYDKISIKFIKTAFHNEPLVGIRMYIETEKPDLLVMFHKPRGLFDKLALDEGATPSIIKKSTIPILAVNKISALKNID
jgi:nucleotide-binding universal stress UspA family protein